MTPDEVISVFRNTVFDTVPTFLWSDDEVRGYLNDAQRMLCRRTYGILDGTTAQVTTYPVNTGDVWFTLHKSVMKIRAASRLSDFKPLGLLNAEDIYYGNVLNSDDYGTITTIRFDNLTGELEWLVLGITEGQVRLLRIPAEPDTVQLTVERLPLRHVSEENLKDENALEVREEHHRHLVWWMAHLAYLKQDAETLDKTKSAMFEQKFAAYCDQARQEKERRVHKSRITAYGGY